MQYNQYLFNARVWLYPGKSGWYFISVPTDISADIHEKFADRKRGWGSVPVHVVIGGTRWKTSIFPDTKAQCFLLPLKQEVRKIELIELHKNYSILLEII